MEAAASIPAVSFPIHSPEDDAAMVGKHKPLDDVENRIKFWSVLIEKLGYPIVVTTAFFILAWYGGGWCGPNLLKPMVDSFSGSQSGIQTTLKAVTDTNMLFVQFLQAESIRREQDQAKNLREATNSALVVEALAEFRGEIKALRADLKAGHK